MAVTTLKSLQMYLRLLENASEMKRKMPASPTQRSLKDGLSEISQLAGLDSALFKDPKNIAAMIGAQRFVMIWGEPSVTAYVARIFDSSKVLLTVLIDPGHFEVPAAQSGSSQSRAGGKPLSPGGPPPLTDSPGAQTPASPGLDAPLANLKPLLSGNQALTGQLFRLLFEHMLGFASPSSAQQGSAVLVNELTGSKEHGRSFLASAMFLLGAEIDRENLISFMLEQGLFGMQLFEQLLLNREYCDAFYNFRRLGRAFIAPPAEEETQLRARMDRLNIQFGGKACDTQMFEADEDDKARIDAHLAAMDVLEALALTPWSLSLSNAITATAANGVRSMKTIAWHFERYADGEETREQANKEIADHLLAFARQFSADGKSSSRA